MAKKSMAKAYCTSIAFVSGTRGKRYKKYCSDVLLVAGTKLPIEASQERYTVCSNKD